MASKMTRQHFELIAAVLRDSKPGPAQSDDRLAQWELMVKEFTEALARTNPGFDRDRFIWRAVDGQAGPLCANLICKNTVARGGTLCTACAGKAYAP